MMVVPMHPQRATLAFASQKDDSRKPIIAHFQRLAGQIANHCLRAAAFFGKGFVACVDAIRAQSSRMSAQELIAEFKELPPAERAQVAKFVVEFEGSWIPGEFKEAMKHVEAGRLVDMETALSEIPPPRLK